MNQVRYGFSLGQIDTAIEKRTPSELARLSQACAILQNGVQDQLGCKEAAMTGDLNAVFACERAWSAHDREQHFVDRLSLADDMAEMNGVRGSRRGFQGGLASREEAFVRNGQGIRTGNSDQRESSFT